MELNKLKVLKRDSRPGSHRVTVAGASVSACRREIRASISSRGEDGLMRLEAVQRAILHAESENPTASPILIHDKIQSKVLDCNQI